METFISHPVLSVLCLKKKKRKLFLAEIALIDKFSSSWMTICSFWNLRIIVLASQHLQQDSHLQQIPSVLSQHHRLLQGARFKCLPKLMNFFLKRANRKDTTHPRKGWGQEWVHADMTKSACGVRGQKAPARPAEPQPWVGREVSTGECCCLTSGILWPNKASTLTMPQMPSIRTAAGWPPRAEWEVMELSGWNYCHEAWMMHETIQCLVQEGVKRWCCFYQWYLQTPPTWAQGL